MKVKDDYEIVVALQFFKDYIWVQTQDRELSFKYEEKIIVKEKGK